ncbi:MAG: hypothetical protein PHS54_01940 [Clostridia bacterium]|nr:hypothetical protein [Clostridia bacterium]
MKDFIKEIFAPVKLLEHSLNKIQQAKTNLSDKLKEEIKNLQAHVSYKDHDTEVQKIKDKYIPQKMKNESEYNSLILKFNSELGRICDSFSLNSQDLAKKLQKVFFYETNEYWEIKELNLPEPELWWNDIDCRNRYCLCLVSPTSSKYTKNLDLEKEEIPYLSDRMRNISQKRRKHPVIKIAEVCFWEETPTFMLPLEILGSLFPIKYGLTKSLTDLTLNLTVEDKSFINTFVRNTYKIKEESPFSHSRNHYCIDIKKDWKNPLFENCPFLENYLHKIILGEDLFQDKTVEKKFHEEESRRQLKVLEKKELSIKLRKDRLANKEADIIAKKQKLLREDGRDQ